MRIENHVRFEIHTIKTDKCQPFKNDIVQPQGIISTLVTIGFVWFFLYTKKEHVEIYLWPCKKKRKKKE